MEHESIELSIIEKTHLALLRERLEAAKGELERSISLFVNTKGKPGVKYVYNGRDLTPVGNVPSINLPPTELK